MATIAKNFRVKNGLVVEGTTATVNGHNVLTANNSTDDVTEGSANLFYTDERVQDAVDSLITAGTHSNITITYDDEGNSLSFAAENGVADSDTDDLTEGTSMQPTTQLDLPQLLRQQQKLLLQQTPPPRPMQLRLPQNLQLQQTLQLRLMLLRQQQNLQLLQMQPLRLMLLRQQQNLQLQQMQLLRPMLLRQQQSQLLQQTLPLRLMLLRQLQSLTQTALLGMLL